ncbi:hypothetical protein BDN72DRAFT_893700 [Pluteus cervinus]|uniref:Uncharacterized protein n=1 Tax=Pluteus cervinus TaxID=181527 RepID=A0ACD3B7R6_9AGAR|nr:hypothetical protein BDN72DRAFT_893700 [Pluteus cervinus]
MTSLERINYVVFNNIEFGHLEVDASTPLKELLNERAFGLHDVEYRIPLIQSSIVSICSYLEQPRAVQVQPKDNLFDRAIASEMELLSLDRIIEDAVDTVSPDILHVVVAVPRFGPTALPLLARNKALNEVLKLDILPLALDHRGLTDTGFCYTSSARTKGIMVVRKSCRTLLHRTFKLRLLESPQGVIVTGQPGIGKTTWLWFMLVSIIACRRPVLFHTSNTGTQPFHDGQIYRISENPHPFLQNTITYALIDVDLNLGPPPGYLVPENEDTFPIQASSPNKEKYDRWTKQRNPGVWGMPLWENEELLRVVLAYDSDALRTIYLKVFPGLERLNEYSQSLDPIQRFDRMLQSLLTEKHGPIPRDVYNALFQPKGPEYNPNVSLEGVSLTDLLGTMKSVGTMNPTWARSSPSHKLISIGVKARDTPYDLFGVQLRSPMTHQRIVERTANLKQDEAKRLASIYQRHAKSIPPARWIFEGLVHRALSGVYSGTKLYDVFQ